MSVLLVLLLVLSGVLGAELVSRVPQTLHTPLVAALCGLGAISLVGALLVAGQAQNRPSDVLAVLAVGLSTACGVGATALAWRLVAPLRREEKQP